MTPASTFRPPAFLAVVAILLSAQTDAAGQYDPVIHGQWEGPYTLLQITNEHPDNPLGEITHVIVLPDTLGRVLFWCRPSPLATYYPDPNAHGGLWGPTHTFLWRSSNPTNVTEITVPNNLDGSEDFFCNGHQQQPDGNPFVLGGQDMTVAPGQTKGHAAAFFFDRSTNQWIRRNPAMTKPRWYPYGFVTGDFEITILGHAFDPPAEPPGELIVEYNDRWTWLRPTRRSPRRSTRSLRRTARRSHA